MPKAFESCIKAGGKVRTISGPDKKFDLKGNEYIKVCFLKGKMYKGYKAKKEKSKTAQAVVEEYDNG